MMSLVYEWLSGIVDYVSSSSLSIHDISILFVSNKVDVAHALDLFFCHLLMNNNIRCITNVKYLDVFLNKVNKNFSKWKKNVFVRFIGKQKIVLQDKLFDITDETFTNYLTCLFFILILVITYIFTYFTWLS